MRMQEVFELALDELSRTGYRQRLGAGIVLTGGGAQSPGVVELAREVFAMPVRVGKPGQGLSGLTDSVESPRMAVTAGLLLYGAKESMTGGGFGPGLRSPAVEKVFGPVRRWLQDFF
jgi:cell division protein FtsA